MRVILAGPSEPGRQVSRPRKTVFALVTLVAGLVASSACEKVPLLAPSQATITLSAGSTIVQVNGSTDISATVLEQSGTPVHNGTVVTFSTTLGTIEPKEARTVNGTATVRFIATGQSGEAEIRAASGGAKPADTANPSIKIKVGAAAAARIQVAASPSRVGGSGGSSTITATVSDTTGNPLSGIPVTFTSDAGTLSSSIATTSSSGQAQVTLTTTREATVTATAGATGTAAAASGTVKVTVSSLPTLTLAVVTQNPIEGQVVAFTLTVAGSATTDPFQSVVVDFGDGKSSNLGPITAGAHPLTNTYSSDGTYFVRATGTGFNGDTTGATAVVTIADRPPLGIAITTSPASPAEGDTVTFTITVTAANASIVRSVSINYGDGDVVSLGTATSITVNHRYCCSGTYTVTVTATDNFGIRSSASTQVTVAARPPLNVTLTAEPNPTTPGTVVKFTATVTKGGTAATNVARYEWDFGDSSGVVTTSGNTTSHVYSSNSKGATRTATVKAVTTDGVEGTGRVEVQVN